MVGRALKRLPFSLRPFADVYEVTGGRQGWHVTCVACRDAIWLPRHLIGRNNEIWLYLVDHAVQHRSSSLREGR